STFATFGCCGSGSAMPRSARCASIRPGMMSPSFTGTKVTQRTARTQSSRATIPCYSPVMAARSDIARKTGHRIERDTMGEVRVAADRYWGAQTQRSLENFRIGTERMPTALIRAFGAQKLAAAEANMALGMLDRRRGRAIVRAAAEVRDGVLDDH